MGDSSRQVPCLAPLPASDLYRVPQVWPLLSVERNEATIEQREQPGAILALTSERKKWNRLPPPVKAQQLAEWASELKGQWQKDVLLILNYAIDRSQYPIAKTGTFLGGTAESETYHLHLTKYQPPSGGI